MTFVLLLPGCGNAESHHDLKLPQRSSGLVMLYLDCISYSATKVSTTMYYCFFYALLLMNYYKHLILLELPPEPK